MKKGRTFLRIFAVLMSALLTISVVNTTSMDVYAMYNVAGASLENNNCEEVIAGGRKTSELKMVMIEDENVPLADAAVLDAARSPKMGNDMAPVFVGLLVSLTGIAVTLASQKKNSNIQTKG